MSKFDDFVDAVLKGSKGLSKEMFEGLTKQVTEDTNAFLEKCKIDIERWTKQLAEGKITREDFADLVQARKAVAEMHALTESGATLAAIERFRTGLIDLVIDKAFEILV